MKKLKRIISVILILCMVPIYAVFADTTMSVTFNDDIRRHAGGIVTMTSDADKVWLYWGNNGEKLADHTYLGYVNITKEEGAETGTGTFEIQRYTYIPEGATQILAIAEGSEDIVASYEIPESKLVDMGDKSYSFGAVSDSHVGHSTYPNSEGDFERAYNKMGEYGVSLIANDGDVSSYNLINDWTLYNTKVNAFNEKYPDVACLAVTGNHDASHYDFLLDEWNKYTKDDIVNYKGNTQPEFYDGNTLDYLFRVENDVFIFLNATDWKDTAHTIDYYSHEQLEWLERRLEENKDKRVFLFIHYGTFLSHVLYNSEGAYSNGGGFEENDYMSTMFTYLYEKYPNIIAFFGHTHKGFDRQLGQYVQATAFSNTMNANINDINGGATVVHIPSLTQPNYYAYNEETGTAGYVEANERSEAYMVDVYDDCVVLRGYDFMTDEFISYANYIVELKALPNDVEVDNKNLLDTTGRDVTIKGTAGEENANKDVVMMLTDKGTGADGITKDEILYYDQQKSDESGAYTFSFKLPDSVSADEFDVYVNINGENMSETVTETQIGSAWLDASIEMVKVSPEKVKAIYTLKNYSDEDIEAHILLAAYDENGMLVNVQTENKLMPPGTEGERFSAELGEDVASVAAFAMSADGVILPLCRSGRTE